MAFHLRCFRSVVLSLLVSYFIFSTICFNQFNQVVSWAVAINWITTSINVVLREWKRKSSIPRKELDRLKCPPLLTIVLHSTFGMMQPIKTPLCWPFFCAFVHLPMFHVHKIYEVNCQQMCNFVQATCSTREIHHLEFVYAIFECVKIENRVETSPLTNWQSVRQRSLCIYKRSQKHNIFSLCVLFLSLSRDFIPAVIPTDC